MTPFERRIAALEAAKASRPIPCILRVPFGQTIAEARAAFDAEHNPPPGHNVLVVPAKPRTDAEQALWEERFHASQTRLIADAQRERVMPANVAEAGTLRPKFFDRLRPIAGPYIWKPQA